MKKTKEKEIMIISIVMIISSVLYLVYAIASPKIMQGMLTFNDKEEEAAAHMMVFMPFAFFAGLIAAVIALILVLRHMRHDVTWFRVTSIVGIVIQILISLGNTEYIKIANTCFQLITNNDDALDDLGSLTSFIRGAYGSYTNSTMALIVISVIMLIFAAFNLAEPMMLNKKIVSSSGASVIGKSKNGISGIFSSDNDANDEKSDIETENEKLTAQIDDLFVQIGRKLFSEQNAFVKEYCKEETDKIRSLQEEIRKNFAEAERKKVRRCPVCNNELMPGAKKCLYCGSPVDENDETTTPEQRNTMEGSALQNEHKHDEPYVKEDNAENVNSQRPKESDKMTTEVLNEDIGEPVKKNDIGEEKPDNTVNDSAENVHVCPVCGWELEKGQTKCPICGTNVK